MPRGKKKAAPVFAPVLDDPIAAFVAEPSTPTEKTLSPFEELRMAKADEGTITKTEAIKRAIAAGKDTASVGVPWIKHELGLDVSPAAFATQKSQLNKKAGGGEKANPEAVPAPKRGRKPGSKNKPKATTTAVAAPSVNGSSNHGRSTSGGVDLSDLEAVKGLVAKLGGETVKRYVGLFE